MMRVFLNKRQLFTDNPFQKNTSRASVWLMEAVLHIYFFMMTNWLFIEHQLDNLKRNQPVHPL